MYEYHMVQVPPNISVSNKQQGNEAATYLQNVVNHYAQNGWEFFRIDQIGVQVRPGCLAALSGTKTENLAFSTPRRMPI
ncbi:hypothetical protein [Pinirhizobacter soli]|uniref:hypothetical protein n=1 Tax=Pinirhizobacter soli TaxID=2786953 RepID=UPI002029E8EE|nr:hypothetical protein [Pinirhizobacter soli]